MTVPAKLTPHEFGDALRTARLGAGASLEAISERTKISLRILAALEGGEFARLPNRAFARLFLRQYIEIIGASADEWLARFDSAWEGFLGAGQPAVVGLPSPPRGRRVGPWVVGLLLVASAVAALLLIERRQRPLRTAAAIPTAEVLVASPAPVPTAAPLPTPEATPTRPPDAGVLVITTGTEPCWIAVRVAGEKTASRLLPAGARWEIPAFGRDVDVVFGDAGAVSIAYLSDNRSPVGRRGEVARVHLRGNARPAENGQ